LIAKSNWLW